MKGVGVFLEVDAGTFGRFGGGGIGGVNLLQTFAIRHICHSAIAVTGETAFILDF